jgi:hypothetical protein
VAHKTIWEQGGIYVRYSGHASDAEIGALIRVFQSDYRFDDVRYIIHDFRDCDGLTFVISVVEELAATDSAAAMNKPKHRVAIVTDREDVRAMVKAYVGTGFHPPDKLQIFSQIEPARAWTSSND